MGKLWNWLISPIIVEPYIITKFDEELPPPLAFIVTIVGVPVILYLFVFLTKDRWA